MIRIVLVGVSQEAADASKEDILAYAAKLRRNADIMVLTNFDDLPKHLHEYDILALEDRVAEMSISRIFAMLRDFEFSSQKHPNVVVYRLPIGEPCLEKWFELLTPKEVAIPLLKGQRSELVSDIIYFENRSRKVYVKTSESSYPTNLRMKQAKELTVALPFLSPYVGYLVNLHWVEQIGSRDIILKNKDTIPLSQKRASAFRKAYRDFYNL